MLILQDVSYLHPDKDLLFSTINLVINKHEKVALIGNNGSGKSTLLKLMAGLLPASNGGVVRTAEPYYLPQIFGQYDHFTVAEALGVDEKLASLHAILAGDADEHHLQLLNDDWNIEERCEAALTHWNMPGIKLTTRLSTLSGGQKTKVFLAGIIIHRPELVLMDEPSNHLDREARKLLYDYIVTTKNTLVVVSHDRTLLNMMGRVMELSKKGLNIYGGNYSFFAEQKQIEAAVLVDAVSSKEKEVRKAREMKRVSVERQQKLDARGKRKQEKAGLPTISMNTLRNNAEKSTSRINSVHERKVDSVSGELGDLRKELPDIDKIRISLHDAAVHNGKVLIRTINLVPGYQGSRVMQPLPDMEIRSGQRICIRGANGSGKTTLIRTILGDIPPVAGEVERVPVRSIYVDQEYTLIQDRLTVFEQAARFNTGMLAEHEIKIRLNRFLFPANYWDKLSGTLSGGEKMRLMLCCLTIGPDAPEIVVLDEPTNNLDLQNVEILASAIKGYQGTLLVISHDEAFLDEIGILETINL